jgi:hypothetical protein
MLMRVAAFLCGPFCYPVYFASFLHVIDFFANVTVPKSIDSEPRLPLAQKLFGGFRIATCSETKEIRKTC